MAKSLNKQQLVNVVSMMMVAEMVSRDYTLEEADKEVLKSYLEDQTVEDLVDMVSDIPGATDDYIDYIESEEQSEDPVDEDDVPSAEDMKEILDNLHAGFNMVPGLGAGFAADEEDLKALRVFVAGALAVKGAIHAYMS